MPTRTTGDTGILRLRERAIRAEEVARVLGEFATSLVTVHDEEEILWEVTQRCISALGFEDCVLYLLDEARGVLVQRAAYGPKNPRGREILEAIEVPLGRGIVGSVALTQQAEVIRDTRLDSRYIVDDRHRLSELAVPIVSDGRTLGVIDSEHSEEDYFTPEHLTILKSIAALCANKLVRASAERKLREWNITLEERVRQRTSELAAANAHLEKEMQERARTAEALRASTRRLVESEERFRLAFRSIPASVALVRLSDGRFIEANEAFVQLSGFSKSEIIGRTSEELRLWNDRSRREVFWERFLADGFVHGYEAEFRSKSGGISTAILSAERVEIDGEPCLLSLSLDIADRKRMEEELRQNLNRERELSRLRSAFVSLVSHEFRTPISIVHSSAEILERYSRQLTDADRTHHLETIKSNAWRMTELMEGVLLFGKAEAGRLSFKPAAFDLGESVERWVREMSMATQGRCRITLNIDSTESLAGAHGDVELLRHVVCNLISNGVKYSPPGSEVAVGIRVVAPDVFIVVRDRGVGIPESDRQKLFSAFQRGSNVGQIPGTGIGLVVIKHCLDLHSGGIQIDSEEAKGTTVTVRVPVFSKPKV